MIKNITGTGISRDHAIKIRPHPGATSIDMFDYIKPGLRHQPISSFYIVKQTIFQMR